MTLPKGFKIKCDCTNPREDDKGNCKNCGLQIIKQKQPEQDIMTSDLVLYVIVAFTALTVLGILEGIFDLFNMGETGKIGLAVIICAVFGGMNMAFIVRRKAAFSYKRGSLPS
jgi:hypothetical protein